jgi:serine O-acetyltransferase
MNSTDPIWEFIQQEAQQLASEEPLLAGFFQEAVLQHSSLEAVVGYVLSETFVSTSIGAEDIRKVITQALESDPKIGISIRRDIEAAFERDAACQHYLTPLIYFKGFQALQLYRISHWL